MLIARILVFSYYHPWVAGGGHRPHQILLEELCQGREIAFIFSSATGIDEAQAFANDKKYEQLALYYFDNGGILKPLTLYAKSLLLERLTLDDLLNEWVPSYARAHNPVQSFVPFIERLKASDIPFIYDQMDFWSGFGVQPWGTMHTEQVYIDLADAITTISRFLLERISDTSKVNLLPNAISSSFLTELLIKGRTSWNHNYGQKRVLYMGAMWPDWFDWELIFHVVERRSEYLFTFVGAWTAAVDEDDGRPTNLLASKLSSYNNVTLVGEVQHMQLVQWLCESDVGIVPFVVNDVTIACSPLKVFEYLGTHLPVVSTALPEIQNYPLVAISNNYEEFIGQLDKAIHMEINEATRLEVEGFCEKNTWKARVDTFDAIVGGLR